MFAFEFTTLGLIGGAALLLVYGLLVLLPSVLYGVARVGSSILYYTVRGAALTVGLHLLLLWWVGANVYEALQRAYWAIAARSASKNSSAN